MRNYHERIELVDYGLNKSKEVLDEAKETAKLQRWNLVANRLYYSVFHACNALTISKGLISKTHDGVLKLTSEHFIKTHILDKEDSKLLSYLKIQRKKGEYDDFIDVKKEEIEEYIPQVEKFVTKVENILEKIKEEIQTNNQPHIEYTLNRKYVGKSVKIIDKTILTTNKKPTGELIHFTVDGRKKTCVTDFETKDICLCNNFAKPGSFYMNMPWTTISGKPAAYTPTRVISVENKKKFNIT